MLTLLLNRIEETIKLFEKEMLEEKNTKIQMKNLLLESKLR